METAIICPNDPLWMDTLSEAWHDVYHLPEYVQMEADNENGKAAAFVAIENGTRLFVPLIIRPLPEALGSQWSGWYDATSPYGYPGPLLCTGDQVDIDGFIERALSRFREDLSARKIVAAFFRLHPFLSPSAEQLSHLGHLVHHGETVSIDLTLPEEEIWRQTRPTHRQGIRRNRRLGHHCVFDDWSAFDSFIRAYWQTMVRVKASKYYFFDRNYFKRLTEALGTRIHLATVYIDGEVAAGALFTELNGIVQCHLCGTLDRYLPFAPTKLIFDEARWWAKKRGNKTLHLGGGVGGHEDSLFHFKAGFSKQRHPFHTWGIITDEEKYYELVRTWKRLYSADPVTGYFPAYRAPVPVTV